MSDYRILDEGDHMAMGDGGMMITEGLYPNARTTAEVNIPTGPIASFAPSC